ncbi:MAG: DUF87 domain-containing protein [Pseudomonadota bacterium]
MEQVDVGAIVDINGSRAICRLDLPALVRRRQDATTSLEAASSVGGYVKVDMGGTWLLGTITRIEAVPGTPDAVVAEVDLIGEGDRGADGNYSSFRRGVTLYPHPGDRLYLATLADLQRVYSPEDEPHIEIGTVYPSSEVRASVLMDRLLSRHFAVLGATGSGKSTTVALMLHRIIDAAPEGHIVMLDPHGEYSSAFPTVGRVFNVDNLHIPYWLMNLQEHCEAFIHTEEESAAIDAGIMAKCLFAARSRSEARGGGSKVTADSPIPYALGDLLETIDSEMGRLDKATDAYRYARLKANIQQLFADRRYRFIFNNEYRTHSMVDFISDLLRVPAKGQPISIIDLAGVPSEIVDVVVSILTRLILEYAIWSPREDRIPILLVCEEAQRYLPAAHTGLVMSAERQLGRIAREGRKYGVSLGIITQRPSELSETALSQCGTIFAMRLNNLNDQARIRDTLPEGARGFVDLIPALQSRECIVSGEGAPVSMRVRIDTLEAELRPASDDPPFQRLWGERRADNAQVEQTVRRWRGES